MDRFMTSLLRHAARSTGLTSADTHAAESVLGRRHALTRAVANQHTLAMQSAVAVLAVVAAALCELVHLQHATLLVVVALGICAAFVVAWTLTRETVARGARDLIAGGYDNLVLSVVARERRRLASRKERERLARALEEFHRDALRRHPLLPHSQLLPGVAQLRHTSREVEALATALRRERARVQGVALVARLLADGHESPLYAGERGPLREELNRIRYLLESAEERAPDAPAERKAA